MATKDVVLKLLAIMEALDALQSDGATTEAAASTADSTTMELIEGVEVPVEAVRRIGRGPHPRSLIGSEVRVLVPFKVIAQDAAGALRLVPVPMHAQ